MMKNMVLNFPKEPHRSKKNCLFQHTKQNEADDSSCLNEKMKLLDNIVQLKITQVFHSTMLIIQNKLTR
jgi:hypothetical protein